MKRICAIVQKLETGCIWKICVAIMWILNFMDRTLCFIPIEIFGVKIKTEILYWLLQRDNYYVPIQFDAGMMCLIIFSVWMMLSTKL